MEELDMNYLCSVMGSLSGVPIRLYDGDELEFFYSTVHLPKDPIVVYKDRLWAIGSLWATMPPGPLISMESSITA